MKSYYQDIITNESWKTLLKLRKEIDFVLLGGWAVYLYTQALKSKDIDIIVEFDTLGRLKNEYEIRKNERLQKYEIIKEGIEIDIYLPYYSYLGMPVEKLVTLVTQLQSFKVLKKEALVCSKLYAYLNRRGSIKGEKDRIDILNLLLLEDFNVKTLNSLLGKSNFDELRRLVKTTRDIKEIGLNQHRWAKDKKRILSYLI